MANTEIKLIKGLNLIDRVPEELQMEVHDIVQEAVIKTIPKTKKYKKAKEKRKDIPICMQSSKE